MSCGPRAERTAPRAAVARAPAGRRCASPGAARRRPPTPPRLPMPGEAANPEGAAVRCALRDRGTVSTDETPAPSRRRARAAQ
jgi:hypothetical protein